MSVLTKNQVFLMAFLVIGKTSYELVIKSQRHESLRNQETSHFSPATRSEKNAERKTATYCKKTCLLLFFLAGNHQEDPAGFQENASR